MPAPFDLNRLRHDANMTVLCGLWAHVVMAAVLCRWLGITIWAPVLALIACAAVVQVTVMQGPQSVAARTVASVGLMVSVSVLVGLLAGQKLQVDLHMYYFAALACLLVYCDWRVIIAAAGFVAVHHLTLNFLLPAAIYPGGTDIARFLVHAVVLVIEAAALIWISATLEALPASLSRAIDEAQAAVAEAEASRSAVLAAAAQAETERTSHDAAQAAAEAERHYAVGELGSGLLHLAEGDLTCRLSGFSPAFHKMQDDFNRAAMALQAALQTVMSKTDAIRAGSNDLSEAANDVAKRIESQATGLKKTAASLAQITVNVTRTAEGAAAAGALVAAARSGAQHSGEVVRAAVAAVGELAGSAQQISQITGIIDEIALQTNLLALNAGVEAARAGDSGRGFAVVASEVRALAQRSADAARDIKRLISASSQQVERGVHLVGQTGQALEGIVGNVDHLARLVGDMAAAVHEQSSALREVNATISQVSDVTQQNSVMLEESTSASQSLAAETADLARLSQQFRVHA